MEVGLTGSAAPALQHRAPHYARLTNEGSYPRRSLIAFAHRLHNAGALATGDALALSLAMLVAGSLRLLILGEPVVPIWSWYLLPAWWGGAYMARLLPGWGLGSVEELRRITLLLLLVYASLAVALFLTKQGDSVSRLTLTIALMASLITVPYLRSFMKRSMVEAGTWGVSAVVYGAGETGQRVVRLLQEERGLGYNPIGLFDDDQARWGNKIDGVPVVGGTDLVLPEARVAIVAAPSMGPERLVELLDGPLGVYRSVMIIPNLSGVPSLWVRPRNLSGLLGLEITSNLVSPLARFFKRAFDATLVCVAAPLWMPLVAILALLVRLEDGASPFFTQERVGRDGNTFKAIKLRTMVPDAEKVLAATLEKDEAVRAEWEQFRKLQVDPRVTRLGDFLRAYSLDELPQLINVLRGEMTLVGPRPLPSYHHRELAKPIRTLRRRVRPGVTGLWQVSGRENPGAKEMERWDGYYVRNWSLWLDTVVLVRTVRAVFARSGV